MSWTYTGEAARLREAIEKFLEAWDGQAGALRMLNAVEGLREAMDKTKTIHIVKGEPHE